MNRKSFLSCVALAVTASAVPAAQAQSYPVRPIKIVTPFPVGQGPDVLLRSLAEELGKTLGQPVVIENKPGASGFVAFQTAKSAPADGYTLVHMDSFHIGTQPHLFSKLPYSATQDFDPVTPLVRNYFFVVVPANAPWKNIGELLAEAKRQPGGITYGSWGVASPAHLGGLVLENTAKVQMLHVPYKESSQLYSGVANGELNWAIGSAISADAMLQAGKVRLLAAAAPARIAGYDQVPTAAETGAPAQWSVGGWNGLLAPKGTPAEIVNRLNAAIVQAMDTPKMRERLALFTYESYTMSPNDMSALMKQEQDNWGPIIRTAGISLD